MNRIKKFLLHETMRYLFFGVLTTAVSLGSYYIMTKGLHIHYVAATILSWVLSVLFAFVTNKLFVFDSKTLALTLVAREFTGFISARLFSGVFELAWMFCTVDILRMDDFYAKIAANVIIVVLNYILSKFFVFNQNRKR